MSVNSVTAYEPNTAGTSGSAASSTTAATMSRRITRGRLVSRRAPPEHARGPEQQDDHEQREAHELLQRGPEEDRAERLGHGHEQTADERAQETAHAADDHDVERGDRELQARRRLKRQQRGHERA